MDLTEEVLGKLGESFKSKSVEATPVEITGAAAAPPIVSFGGALEEAANLLLSLLVPPIRSYAFECADITLKIPRWQLLLGSLMAQYDSGCLVAPAIDPSWKQIEALIPSSICAHCKITFTPKKVGQVYCTQTCGDEVRLIEKAERQKKEREETEKRKAAAEQRRWERIHGTD